MMPATLPVTRTEHSPDELRELASRCENKVQAMRARAIAMVMEGASRREAGRAQGMSMRAGLLRNWVERYNEEGFDGLANRPHGGGRSLLTDEQIAEVGRWAEEGPDPERDGVTHWQVKDLQRKIEETFDVAYTEAGLRDMLRRVGFASLPGVRGVQKRIRRRKNRRSRRSSRTS